MRTSEWYDFPEVTAGYLGGANCGASTEGSSKRAAIDYFGGTAHPPGAVPLLKDFVEYGGNHFSWAYFPTLGSDDWTGADLSHPDPPLAYTQTHGNPGASYSVGYGQVGRSSENTQQWLLLQYNTIIFTKHASTGSLAFLSNYNLNQYLMSTYAPTLPAFSGDNSWTEIETNAMEFGTPILPDHIELGINVIGDANRIPGSLIVYAQWLPRDNTPVTDYWAEQYPGAGWIAVGTIDYSQSAGWATGVLSLSSLSFDQSPTDSSARYNYAIALAFRNSPGGWIDPTLGPDPDGPYNSMVQWDDVRLSATYSAGTLKYRYIGPENVEGGSSSAQSYIGVSTPVVGGFPQTPTIYAITGNSIVDTISWPYTADPRYDTNLLAVARPLTRAGNRASLLLRDNSYNYSISHLTLLDSGKLQIDTINPASGNITVAGYHPDYVGGNETSRVLCGSFYTSAMKLVNLETGYGTVVSGITDPANWSSRTVASFSQGDTYLVMHTVGTTYSWYGDLHLQRYSIAPSGEATAVGPLMRLPNIRTADRAFDYRYIREPEAVWDDGEYVAVGFQQYRDAPYSDVSLMLAIFNYVSSDPIHIVTLHTCSNSFNDFAVSNIKFAYTKHGYVVSYTRPALHVPDGHSQEDFSYWYSHVTRTINPATGELGPEVLGSDTSDPTFYPLVRADAGSTLAVMQSGSHEKLGILNASATSTAEGIHTLVDWMTGYFEPELWVGINGIGGDGRLYFKHQAD